MELLKLTLKILILPNNYYPTSHSVLEEVYANILQNRGHKITFIMQSSKKQKKNENIQWKGTQVYVTMASPGTSHFNRFMNNIWGFIGKILIIHKISKNEIFDIVQVKEGIFEGLLGIYIKKRNGIPFSFQYTFPSPEARIYAYRSGIARYPLINLIRGKIGKNILMWIMHKADLVLPVSKEMKKELLKVGLPAEKMMIFPMGINSDMVPKDKQIKEISKNFKLDNCATIIYVGTMNKSRNLEFLLRTIVKVKERIKNIKLLMVGDGNDRHQLEEFSKSLDIYDNIIFTGRIPRSQVTELIASADIGVSPIPPIDIFKVGSATKIIEYMAMKKPVIGNDIADQKEVINCSGGGICVQYDEEKFAFAIKELLDNPQKAKEMGENGREWVVRNRSYEILAHNLEQRYFNLIQSDHTLKIMKEKTDTDVTVSAGVSVDDNIL